MSAVADKLREAKALIERGWCQGEARIGDSYCILGATGEVANDEVSYFDLTEPLRQAVNGRALAKWNDAPERTQAEAIAAFEKAIELAEAAQ